MIAIWYLLMLAPLIAIAIFWWSYRRKQTARERVAGERWQQIVSQAASSGNDAPAATAESAAPVAAHPLQSAQPLAPLPYRRRERLLDPGETLFYFLLRTQIPECEVLCDVSLKRLLSIATTSESENERLTRGLSQHAVNFVLCDKAMQPRVAIDLLAGEAPAALTAAPDFKTQCLAHGGIRYVRISRTALPKRQDVRNVVLGSADAV